MNYSLVAADRMTHVKIVVVALLASIAVIAAGVYALPTEPDFTIGHVRADLSLVKASALALVSDHYWPAPGSADTRLS